MRLWQTGNLDWNRSLGGWVSHWTGMFAAIVSAIGLMHSHVAAADEAPKADKASEITTELTLDRAGKLTANGKEHPDAKTYVAREADAVRKLRKLGKDDELPVTVRIAADERTKFSTLYQVINACQDQGYRKFCLSTSMPSDKREINLGGFADPAPVEVAKPSTTKKIETIIVTLFAGDSRGGADADQGKLVNMAVTVGKVPVLIGDRLESLDKKLREELAATDHNVDALIIQADSKLRVADFLRVAEVCVKQQVPAVNENAKKGKSFRLSLVELSTEAALK